jgi:16S rRNA (adenine1518-N6/adenine1519-N6)-dimethyltransferase
MKYAKKSLGQNFLNDKNIIKKIISLINIKNKNIIEIGPGNGALTNEILKKKPKTFFAIEKDSFLSKELKLRYSNNKNFKIFNDDILKFDIKSITKKNTVIFGNLPYNISSQIFVKILRLRKWPSNIIGIIFMFQKELGEKIISEYPSINYGRLSILTNYRLKFMKKFLVSPNCFFPRPKVTSMVIYFTPKIDKNYNIVNLESLEKVTNVLFSNRRKMINKNITKILSKEEVKKIKDLNLSSRPNDIKPKIFFKITELFEK